MCHDEDGRQNTEMPLQVPTGSREEGRKMFCKPDKHVTGASMGNRPGNGADLPQPGRKAMMGFE